MALTIAVATPAFAQEWIEYRDRIDRFGVAMPRQPKVEEITYTSWQGGTVPARVHMQLSIFDEDGRRVRFEVDACGQRIRRLP